MTTSYIEYIDDKGFCINNYFIETALEYICQVIENKVDEKPEWIKEHYDILNNNRLGFFPGMMNLALDYLETQERKEYFIDILEQAINIVDGKGDEIPVDELKSYDDKKNEELRYRVLTPLKSTKIIQILDELIKMINEGEDYNGEHHRPYFKFQDDENIS